MQENEINTGRVVYDKSLVRKGLDPDFQKVAYEVVGNNCDHPPGKISIKDAYYINDSPDLFGWKTIPGSEPRLVDLTSVLTFYEFSAACQFDFNNSYRKKS